MSDIARSEKRIKTLTEKVGASDEGVLWIKESLDPFSDMPRRPVGFPDLITGNSVIQVVKQSKTYVVGETAEDVHIFMDTCETLNLLTKNPYYIDPAQYGGALNVTAVSGLSEEGRGGTVVRAGAVGSNLSMTETKTQILLPQQYCDSGATRVIAKGIEIHNTTNKLNVGGALTVYRDTGCIPYGDTKAITCYAAGSDTISVSHDARKLSNIPLNLAEVTRIPGSQAWNAEEGAYIVATMAAQTNNPTDEEYKLTVVADPDYEAGLWSNISASATPGKPPVLNYNAQLFSPFFLAGAYLTGLPPGTSLTINTIHILERFVDTTNLDLVVLAQPSPFYDPVAMEIYSKTCMRLPHGVKVKDNADGDWIKQVADVLATFGVPGMPLVKGAVDVYNMVRGPKQEQGLSKGDKERIASLEAELERYKVVGSPSKSNIQPLEKKKAQVMQVKNKNSSPPPSKPALTAAKKKPAVVKR